MDGDEAVGERRGVSAFVGNSREKEGGVKSLQTESGAGRPWRASAEAVLIGALTSTKSSFSPLFFSSLPHTFPHGDFVLELIF